MSETVLLTGATGFLGTRLGPVLAELGTCVGVGRRSQPTGGIQLDLTDRNALRAQLDRIRPHHLVHCAALRSPDSCQADPDLAYRMNVATSGVLADWFASNRPEGRVVYISSDQVYDGPGPNTEEDAAPRNVYAMTKLWGEDLIRRHPRALVLRTNFFGLGPSSAGSLADWVVKSAQERRPVTLFRDVFFNPLHITHLADLIGEMFDRRIQGTFNLGSHGEGLSKRDFILRLAQQLGLPVDSFSDGALGDVDLTAARPKGMVMNVTQAEGCLGRGLPTIDQGLDALRQEWVSHRASPETGISQSEQDRDAAMTTGDRMTS